MQSRELSIRAVHAAVLELIRRVRADQPTLDPREAVSNVLAEMSIRCPKCGELTKERAAAVAMSGSGILAGEQFQSPVVRAIAAGCCPDCSGTTVIVSFEK